MPDDPKPLEFEITWEGKKYAFIPKRDLRYKYLRKIKEWYGAELGRWLTFQGALLQLDVDAVACAVWISRQEAGEANVPEPRLMPDFEVGSASQVLSDEEIAERDDPPTRTPASTGTPSGSGAGTSGSSSPASPD